MNENIFTRVKYYLKSKDFTFNESWLRDCVQYCVETHPKLSVEGIQSFAVEQWLLSNLREINNENGCLPKNLSQKKCTTLNGSYILQMEKMYDISTSKYKQLEKIRNISVENLKTTEDVKSESWELKGKRMFQLFFTDGVQEIEAIESKPIDLFNETLLPGYKLKITGPVKCRRGIIMLEKENISSLGGEVEDLLIPNSLENILARSLNFKENPDPYNDTKRKGESEKSDLEEEYLNDLEKLARSQDSKENERPSLIRNNFSMFNLQSEYKLNFEKASEKQNTDELLSDDELEALLNDPDIVDEFPPIEFIQKATVDVKTVKKETFFKDPSLSILKTTQKIKINPKNPNLRPLQSQEFPDDSFDLDDKDWDSSESWNNFQDKRGSDYHKMIQKVKVTENSMPKDSLTSEFSDDNFIVEDQDLIVLDPCDDKSISKPSVVQFSKFSNTDNLGIQKSLKEKYFEPKNSYKSLFLKSNSLTSDKSTIADVDLEIKKLENNPIKGWQIISSEGSIVKSNVIKKPQSLEVTKSANEKVLEPKNSFGTSKPYKPLFPKPSSVITDKSHVDFVMEARENEPIKGLRLFSNERMNLFGAEMDLGTEKSKDDSNNNLEAINIELDLRLKKLLNEPNNNLQSNEATISKLSFIQPASLNDSEESTSKITNSNFSSTYKTENELTEIPIGNKRLASPILSMITNQPKMPRASDTKKISEVKKETALHNEEPPPKFCDFIDDVIKEPIMDEAILKTVRAKIKKKGKLSSKGGLWHLDGLISDGTANLKVQFSSEFMGSILGFTALDFSMMKKRVKTDPKLEMRIRENMRNGQQKLEQTDWLMQLELIKNKTPLVVRAFELTQEQKEVFEKRLQILKP